MAKKKTAAKKTTAKKKKINPEVARWNGHKFKVSSKLIRGFTDLQIKGSSETEDMEKDKDIYVKRKNGQPTEVSMTVMLNAMTGCDVRKEAIAFVSEAKAGETDYFYVGNKKLISAKLLLTSANVKEVHLAPGAKWVRADVQLTFKQSGKGGKAVNSKSGSGSSSGGSKGSSGGGGGGSAALPSSGKVSVRNTSPSSGASGIAGGKVGLPTNSTGTVGQRGATGQKVGSAIASVLKNTTNPAKQYSSAKKAPIIASKAGQVRGNVRYNPNTVSGSGWH